MPNRPYSCPVFHHLDLLQLRFLEVMQTVQRRKIGLLLMGGCILTIITIQLFTTGIIAVRITPDDQAQSQAGWSAKTSVTEAKSSPSIVVFVLGAALGFIIFAWPSPKPPRQPR